MEGESITCQRPSCRGTVIDGCRGCSGVNRRRSRLVVTAAQGQSRGNANALRGSEIDVNLGTDV